MARMKKEKRYEKGGVLRVHERLKHRGRVRKIEENGDRRSFREITPDPSVMGGKNGRGIPQWMVCRYWWLQDYR